MASGSVPCEGDRIIMSDLPLLFADGFPMSLDTLSIDQLEKFIPFMLDCSLNLESSCKEIKDIPIWWPPEVVFQIPLVRTQAKDRKWLYLLRRIVYLCYRYHNATFMLNFCQALSKTPKSDLKFVDLYDGTTTLFKRDTGKLLVTFKNENRTYDKKIINTRKYLLLPREQPKPKPCLDIYLCDNCDAELETWQAVQDHEVVCYLRHRGIKTELSEQEVPNTSENLQSDQSGFLNLFALGNPDVVDRTRTPKPSPEKNFKRISSVALAQKHAVPISSPLGQLLLRKHSLASKTMKRSCLYQIDQYCASKATYHKSWQRGSRRVKWKEDPVWTHSYSFNKKQRLERLLTIETGIDNKSRRLLKRCHPLRVVLSRLTDDEVVEKKRKLTVESQPESATANATPDRVAVPHETAPVNVTDPAKAVAQEPTEHRWYEIFYRPIEWPPSDPTRVPEHYRVCFRPAKTPEGSDPCYKDLIFLCISNKPTPESFPRLRKDIRSHYKDTFLKVKRSARNTVVVPPGAAGTPNVMPQTTSVKNSLQAWPKSANITSRKPSTFTPVAPIVQAKLIPVTGVRQAVRQSTDPSSQIPSAVETSKAQMPVAGASTKQVGTSLKVAPQLICQSPNIKPTLQIPSDVGTFKAQLSVARASTMKQVVTSVKVTPQLIGQSPNIKPTLQIPSDVGTSKAQLSVARASTMKQVETSLKVTPQLIGQSANIKSTSKNPTEVGTSKAQLSVARASTMKQVETSLKVPPQLIGQSNIKPTLQIPSAIRTSKAQMSVAGPSTKQGETFVKVTPQAVRKSSIITSSVKIPNAADISAQTSTMHLSASKAPHLHTSATIAHQDAREFLHFPPSLQAPSAVGTPKIQTVQTPTSCASASKIGSFTRVAKITPRAATKFPYDPPSWQAPSAVGTPKIETSGSHTSAPKVGSVTRIAKITPQAAKQIPYAPSSLQAPSAVRTPKIQAVQTSMKSTSEANKPANVNLGPQSIAVVAPKIQPVESSAKGQNSSANFHPAVRRTSAAVMPMLQSLSRPARAAPAVKTPAVQARATSLGTLTAPTGKVTAMVCPTVKAVPTSHTHHRQSYPTVESLTDSEKEVVQILRDHLNGARPVWRETHADYAETIQEYENSVPTRTLEIGNAVPFIDLCSDDDDDDEEDAPNCNPQSQYNNSTNLPNACLSMPYMQSRNQLKSARESNDGSSTRTRWYERLPKATLISENESLNCFSNRRSLSPERWSHHKKMGLHYQNGCHK